jgi:glycosyltransferase involved in cell wall biosynthesis
MIAGAPTAPTSLRGPADENHEALTTSAAASVPGLRYLMVLPVPFFPLSDTRFAGESAFCQHLRLLKRRLAPGVTSFRVAGPVMPKDTYERNKNHLGEIHAAREGITFVPLHIDAGTAAFWMNFPALIRTIYQEVKNADVVHSGHSHNLARPVEFPAIMMGVSLGKKTIAVTDIDNRKQAWMSYKSGMWPRRSYWLASKVYDPLRNLQLRAVARHCGLVLFKGQKLCDDFGQRRSNVKNFLNAAFSAEHIVADDAFSAKLGVLADSARPLELCYFGRLVRYKGLDRTLQGLKSALDRDATAWRFHVIGAGEEDANLRALAAALGLGDRVVFHGPLRFGPELFAALRPMHVLLATPLSEDTPRSALDAMASGISILAFDTYYYADLARSSSAVATVPWLDTDALGAAIARLVADRSALLEMARRGLAFARENTQEIWLDRRIQWTFELLEPPV